MSDRASTVLLLAAGLLLGFMPMLIDSAISGRRLPVAGAIVSGLILAAVGIHAARRQLRIKSRGLLDTKILICAIGTAVLGVLLLVFVIAALTGS